MDIFGRRSKPGAWPHTLYRVTDDRHVETLVHGIWGRTLQTLSGKGGEVALITTDVLAQMRTKGELHAYDEDAWGICSPERISSCVQTRRLSVVFSSHYLGAIADGDWDGIDFLFTSQNTFSCAGALFQWVQQSTAHLDYKNYPTDGSALWNCPETSLYTKAISSSKRFGEYRSQALHIGGLGTDRGELFIDNIPERCAGKHSWTKVLKLEAQRAIVTKEQEINDKKAAKKRAEEEAERAEQRDLEERKREERAKIKRERARLKELLEKPVQDLSPEEFAKRMQLRRREQA